MVQLVENNTKLENKVHFYNYSHGHVDAIRFLDPSINRWQGLLDNIFSL